jgi:hypothetical protein
MINIKAKCQTLYLMRMQQLHRYEDNITARWLTKHHRLIQYTNPPNWIWLPQHWNIHTGKSLCWRTG